MTPPRRAMTGEALVAVARLIEARTGLRFVGSRHLELANKTERAFADSGCPDWDTYLTILAQPAASPAFERLVASLTVGETYFFRHRAYFDLLEQDILPRVVDERRQTRQLRIWSAGCATGEEAYSLAIVISRLLQDLAAWDVSILGTDLNADFLARARHAQYGPWSLRGVDSLITAAYFNSVGRQHRVKPEIARLVRFAPLNLAEPLYPSPANGTSQLDLILCRNVLIYLEPSVAKAVVARLRASLAPGGWLVVGPSDPSPGLLAGFKPYGDANAIVYQRVEDEPTDRAAPVPPPATTPPVLPRETAVRVPERRPVATPTSAPDRPRVTPRARGRRTMAAASRTADRFGGVERATSPRDGTWQALLREARNAVEDGRLAEAEAYCQQAADGLTPRADPHYLLGILRQARGDDAAALDAFRQALYIDSGFVPALLASAAIYRQHGQPHRARRALERAQRLIAGRADDEPILAEEPITVGRLRDVLASALSGREERT